MIAFSFSVSSYWLWDAPWPFFSINPVEKVKAREKPYLVMIYFQSFLSPQYAFRHIHIEFVA